MRKLWGILALLVCASTALADGYIINGSGWYGNDIQFGKPGNENTLTFSGSTITTASNVTISGTLTASGTFAFPTTVSLVGATTFTGTAGETLTVTRSLTDATAESGMRLNVTALDTTSGTAAQYGFYGNNVASTEALDGLFVADNADSDDNVAAAFLVLNPTRFTSHFDVGNAAAIFGTAATDSWTFTTDGTGTAEFVLSAGSIDGTEVLDDTLNFDDMADALLLDTATSITGTGGEVLSIARTFTDATDENGVQIAVTALDTTSATTAQYALALQNNSSTEGLDACLEIDNADADDAVAAAIKVNNTGGGGYTNILDTPTLDITGTGAITGATALSTSGAVTVGTDGSGADFTLYTDSAGEELLWDASENKLTIDGTNGANALEVTDGNVEFTDNLTVTGNQFTGDGVGAINVTTGLSLVEHGNGTVHKTVFTLTDVSMSITDAGAGDEGWGTLHLYTFPEGGISILGASTDLVVDQSAATGGDAGGTIADDGRGDFTLGSTATADESLSDAGENTIMTSKAMTEPFVSGIGDANAVNGQMSQVLDGTSTAAQAHLNMIFDAGDVTANSAVHLTGTITITWVNVGDF